MNYKPVIPRDFFNQAKLLKCMGQFELHVNHSVYNTLGVQTYFEGESFIVRQNPTDGSLYCSNYRAILKGHEIHLSIGYNSKENYPIIGTYKGAEYYLFDEQGKFMTNFGVGENEMSSM